MLCENGEKRIYQLPSPIEPAPVAWVVLHSAASIACHPEEDSSTAKLMQALLDPKFCSAIGRE